MFYPLTEFDDCVVLGELCLYELVVSDWFGGYSVVDWAAYLEVWDPWDVGCCLFLPVDCDWDWEWEVDEWDVGEVGGALPAGWACLLCGYLVVLSCCDVLF